MKEAPIPIGIVTIVQMADVNFVSLLNLRKFSPKKGPWSMERYQHREPMIVWRPRELHEFFQRMLGQKEE